MNLSDLTKENCVGVTFKQGNHFYRITKIHEDTCLDLAELTEKLATTGRTYFHNIKLSSLNGPYDTIISIPPTFIQLFPFNFKP